MEKIRYYVAAMRLRTLPLSLAGVSLGLLLAAADYRVSWPVALFTVITTVCLQILSNVSNELGDFLNSTDTPDRQGPVYSLSEGCLQKGDFKAMRAVYVIICIASGLAMIWFSFGTFFAIEPLLLMVLGAAAIIAAMRYTLGRNPYGYRGMGDLYVFIFFGLVAVLGSYFIATHTMFWRMLLPAASIGAFSVAVLNVNNIRDMSTDAGKRVTVPLKIGGRWARVYQTLLVAAGWISMLAYSFLHTSFRSVEEDREGSGSDASAACHVDIHIRPAGRSGVSGISVLSVLSLSFCQRRIWCSRSFTPPAASFRMTEGRSAAVIWMLPDYCFSPVYILQMPNVKAL